MDLRDIERALRAGPPDEPDYVPGAFRRSARRAWWLAAAGVLAGGVLLGAVLAMGMVIVRNPSTGGINPGAIAAQLDGSWISDEISFDDWVAGLKARGFNPSDIGEFLGHDPFEQRVRYGLVFHDGEVTIQASYDGAPLEILNFGTYAIDDDGMLRYVETMDPLPAVGDTCHVVARVQTAGDRLSFEVLDFPGCGTDPLMAHTLFFDLLPYTRTGG